MDAFSLFWECINQSDIFIKKEQCEFLWKNFDRLDFSSQEKAQKLTKPSYAKFCQIYELENFKKIKNANKQIVFLHSVAHIEYSAIDIALDACYRFRNLPKEFYKDWLEVANDEIRHFLLINDELKKFGICYGDLPVHNGLFVALEQTSHNFIDRMAILPRHMEANGIDANTNILSKLQNNDELRKKLELIRDEEISHVQKGDKWFKFACKNEKISPKIWLEIVQKYYPKAFCNQKAIDINRRLQAGFTQDEINEILKLNRG